MREYLKALAKISRESGCTRTITVHETEVEFQNGRRMCRECYRLRSVLSAYKSFVEGVDVEEAYLRSTEETMKMEMGL